MTVKDCLDVAGVRTTFGSGMYRENIPNLDSEVVRRIRRSGPIFLGKTNLPSFVTAGQLTMFTTDTA